MRDHVRTSQNNIKYGDFQKNDLNMLVHASVHAEFESGPSFFDFPIDVLNNFQKGSIFLTLFDHLGPRPLPGPPWGGPGSSDALF